MLYLDENFLEHRQYYFSSTAAAGVTTVVMPEQARTPANDPLATLQLISLAYIIPSRLRAVILPWDVLMKPDPVCLYERVCLLDIVRGDI